MLARSAHTDLQRLLEQALARFGLPGRVVVADDAVTLQGPRGPVSAPLGRLGTDWDDLSEGSRQRLGRDLARELVTTHRSLPSPADRGRRGPPGWVQGALAALAAASLSLGGYYTWKWFERPTAEVAPRLLSPEEYAAELTARNRRVCETTRARVLQGARVGPTDVDGWVVELALVGPADGGPPLSTEPALRRYLRRTSDRVGVVAWEDSEVLSEKRGAETAVEVGDDDLRTAEGALRRMVRLTFRGDYVDAYFTPEERIEFVRLANAVARDLGATGGALYARCEGASSNHLGAWFLGRTPQEAAASLLYFQGVERQPSLIRDAALTGAEGPRSRAEVLDTLADASMRLDHRRVAELVGAEDGMVESVPGGTSLRFPFHDGNRAGRAAQALARQLDLIAEP